METIDRKFIILAINPCKERNWLIRFALVTLQAFSRLFKFNVYTEKNAVLFAAKDKAFPGALERYIGECKRFQCGQEHIDSIDLLRARIINFQRTQEIRLPDTDTDCEIDRCIGGKGV